MAYTITDEEVLRNKQIIDKILQAQIKKYVHTMDTNPQVSKKYVNSIQQLCVYVKVIESWEQGRFTNQEYTNYIDSKDYLELVGKVNRYV